MEINENNIILQYNSLIISLQKALKLRIYDIIVESDNKIFIEQLKQNKIKKLDLYKLYKDIKKLEDKFDNIIYKYIKII
jgi:ribonuclease HI